MSKQKYHFLTIGEHSTGRSLFALPGQFLGKRALPTEIIVKDIGNGTALKRAKRKAETGTVFFTTSLRDCYGCLKAKDIHPLHEHNNILYYDVMDEYEKLVNKDKD